jgi:hypothetical protein
MDKTYKKLKNLLTTCAISSTKKMIMIPLQFMKTIMGIGEFLNKKNLEVWRVLSSKNNSSQAFYKILDNSLIVKNGILKWVYLIREVIYFLVLQELVKALLLKQLQVKYSIQFAS